MKATKTNSVIYRGRVDKGACAVSIVPSAVQVPRVVRTELPLWGLQLEVASFEDGALELYALFPGAPPKFIGYARDNCNQRELEHLQKLIGRAREALSRKARRTSFYALAGWPVGYRPARRLKARLCASRAG